MTQSNTKSFTAVGLGPLLPAAVGDTINYNITGTWVGTWALLATDNGGASYYQLDSGTANKASTPVVVKGPDNLAPGSPLQVVFQCQAYTSGTIIAAMNKNEPANTRQVLQCAFAKVGATAGWTAGTAAADTSLAALPQSQTAATLIIPVTGLKIGDVITGAFLLGEIIATSTGDTLDCALHSQLGVAGSITDTNLGSMTQYVSASVNDLFTSKNTKILLTEEHTIVEGESFYLILTGTTAASNSMKIHGAVVNVH